MTTTTSSRFARAPGRALLATLALALAAGVVQTSNAAGPDGPGGMRHEMMGGHGMGGHMGGGMGGMGGMGALHDGRGMDRMLAAVKATPEQRTQIKPIAEALRADMKALHESGAKLHEQGAALFTQPTVDANAVEAHRQQMLAHHDQVSKRMSQAMIDISRVLTPEQRKTLADRMSMRREMMQHRHGGADKTKS